MYPPARRIQPLGFSPGITGSSNFLVNLEDSLEQGSYTIPGALTGSQKEYILGDTEMRFLKLPE